MALGVGADASGHARQNGLSASARTATRSRPASRSWSSHRLASARQALARECLDGPSVSGDRCAYHLWLDLPETCRAEAYAAAALRQGIAVSPASVFAIVPGHAPNAVRLALAAPPLDALRRALLVLRRLVDAADDPMID